MLDNMIHEPGKFEAEPTYAPVLYELMLNGAQDDTLYDPEYDERPFDVFIVDSEGSDLRTRFPYIAQDTYAIVLWVSDVGFCNTAEMTRAEYDKWCADLEEAWANMEEEDDG